MGTGQVGDPSLDQFVAGQNAAPQNGELMQTLWRTRGAALLDKIGPVILQTHSAGGPFGFIVANDRLETSAPGIYAIGDVKGGPAFTHISYDDYRILADNLLGGAGTRTTRRLVPYVVFTDPQLGRVGLTEAEARQQGRPIRVAKMTMDYIARAWEIGEKRGLMKAIVDAETDQILGAAVLGYEGGELMAMFEIAMLGQLPYTVLKEAIFSHPTMAEGINTLFYNFQD